MVNVICLRQTWQTMRNCISELRITKFGSFTKWCPGMISPPSHHSHTSVCVASMPNSKARSVAGCVEAELSVCLGSSLSRQRKYFNQNHLCTMQIDEFLPSLHTIIVKRGLSSSGCIIQDFFFLPHAKVEAPWHKQVAPLAWANLKAGCLALINMDGVCSQETQSPRQYNLPY